MLITIVAGARPNFMKIAPLIKAINEKKSDGSQIDFRLVHTGQHYDNKMSHDFFSQLGIPDPHINLNAGGGSQAEQTAAIMTGFEKDLGNFRPDVVLVVGDVTSTMACAIVAKKMGVDVIHVEAGIRSGDMSMPEEINRIVTDSICDHYFTTSRTANKNLQLQNIEPGRIHFVGNTMIDTLYQNLDKLKQPQFWDKEDLKQKEYFLVTLHRPVNVDDPEILQTIINEISGATKNYKVVFSIHPRTRRLINKISIPAKFLLVDPVGYFEFIYLLKNAAGVITDSGGITEEATVLNVPCLTLRTSTERPETVEVGTNILIGNDYGLLRKSAEEIINGTFKKGYIPELWDGKTSVRIVDKLVELYSKSGN